jgi:NAD(P)-dependent dehydrogenase (short-subunit alcohol dehydrogenase family)
MRSIMQIKNCVAFVTGANRGLGKAFVQALLSAGAAKVYAGARDPNSVELVDSRVVAVALDVTSQASVDAAAKRCTDVNLLINNAAILHATPLMDSNAIGNFRDELEVNAIGILRMAQAFAPVLKSNGGGAIANMLSVVSWFVHPFNPTYCASKHAALAVSDGLRVVLKSQGTHVTSVYAGFIDTDMAGNVDAPKTTPQQVTEKTLEGIEKGLEDVHADEQSENYWRALREDRGLRRSMQEIWDKGENIFAGTRS